MYFYFLSHFLILQFLFENHNMLNPNKIKNTVDVYKTISGKSLSSPIEISINEFILVFLSVLSFLLSSGAINMKFNLDRT